MFYPIPKWAAFVWNVCSVLSVEHNTGKIAYSTLLAMSCVYVLNSAPRVVCILESSCDGSWSTVMKAMFSRTVALTALVSRLVIVLKGKDPLVMYKKNIDDYHTLAPMTCSESAVLRKLSSAIALCSVLLVVPVNVMRIWILLNVEKFSAVFYAIVYVQNFSMYCIETHFAVLCLVLYQKFDGIVGDLTALKINMIVQNRYPFLSEQTGKKYTKTISCKTIEYNSNVLQSLLDGYPVTYFLEELSMKYKLLYKASGHLNNMFGIHLGLSLCSLCLYAMLDLYYSLLNIRTYSKSNVLLYGWILQYSVRFFTVSYIAHITAKQVGDFKDLLLSNN